MGQSGSSRSTFPPPPTNTLGIIGVFPLVIRHFCSFCLMISCVHTIVRSGLTVWHSPNPDQHPGQTPLLGQSNVSIYIPHRALSTRRSVCDRFSALDFSQNGKEGQGRQYRTREVFFGNIRSRDRESKNVPGTIFTPIAALPLSRKRNDRWRKRPCPSDQRSFRHLFGVS